MPQRQPDDSLRTVVTKVRRDETAFEAPVQAVTPGQAAVFYDAEFNEEVLGGGWIGDSAA